MKNLRAKSALINCLLLCALGLNGYLFFEREEASQNLAALNQTIEQQQSLILRASSKPEINAGMSHRLALPTHRLSASDDFQQLSKTLHLQRLDFQISPEKIVATAADALTESSVELKFTNHSDQPLFSMVSHIIEDFPGLVYPVEINMWREESQGDPVIHGSFRFEWLKANSEKI
jgi:hypothetical protein